MRRRLLLFVAVLAIAGAAIPSSAIAGPGFLKAIWGPIKFVPGEGGCPGPDRCSAFPVYHQLGAQVFQFQILWNRVATSRPANPRDPADPAYHWSGDFQFAVDQAALYGMVLNVTVKGTPGWANGGRSDNYAPSPTDYVNFLYAVAAKYPSIRHWQIWGEPTRAKNFLPVGPQGARTYAAILDAAYGALKAINPGNVVIGGMTFNGGNTPKWLKNLRLGKHGPPPRMDWYGHNPFDARFPNLKNKPIGSFRGLNDIDTLWQEIKSHYSGKNAKRRPKKLWLSEWTVQSDHSSWVFNFHVTRAQQAKWLTRGYALARKARYVQGMGWYQLIDYPPVPTNNPNWGLLTYSGAHKSAFDAYTALP